MDKEYLINLIKNAGPHMALVIFFVWQGSQREGRMEKRVDGLHEYIRTEMKSLVQRSQDIIKDNTAALRGN